MADKWASLIGFKPSAGLDEKIYKMRRGQRSGLLKDPKFRKIVEAGIRRSEPKTLAEAIKQSRGKK